MKWYTYLIITCFVIITTKFLRILPQHYDYLALILMIGFTFGIVPLILRLARKISNTTAAQATPRAEEILMSDSSAFILYLRPFQADSTRPKDNLIYRHMLGAYGMPEESYEVSLINKISIIAPIVAIGQPNSEESTQLGAFRYYVPGHENWQEKVADLISQAKVIVFRIDQISLGVEWELKNTVTLRKFLRTAVFLIASKNREKVYEQFYAILPPSIQLQLPSKTDNIQAIYVNSEGQCHLITNPSIFNIIEDATIDKLLEYLIADKTDLETKRTSYSGYSVAGIRCWHKEGIGLTPKNSFAGKIVISSADFKFISAGSSLIKEIFDQGSSLSSANLTQHLDDNTISNVGSLCIKHSAIESMSVVGSIFQTPHIRIKYYGENNDIYHCAIAFDGYEKNSLENLNILVQEYITSRESVDFCY